MKTIPKRSFGSLKPKGDEKASKGIVQEGEPLGVVWLDESEEAHKRTELTQEDFYILPTPVATPVKIKLTSVRLMTIFELLTDKSFPRKSPGKSTKIKILDAIIMAAIDKKLILQEEKDAKSRGN